MSQKPGRIPTIINITLTLADTEYSQLFPSGIKRFSVQATTDVDVRHAFETGKVAGPTAPYATMKQFSIYYEDDVTLTGETLYLASSTAGTVVELIMWK